LHFVVLREYEHLEASFLIFLTLGSIKQSNTHWKGVYQMWTKLAKVNSRKYPKVGSRCHFTCEIALNDEYLSAKIFRIAKSFGWLSNNFEIFSLNLTCLIASEQCLHIYVGQNQLSVGSGWGNSNVFLGILPVLKSNRLRVLVWISHKVEWDIWQG